MKTTLRQKVASLTPLQHTWIKQFTSKGYFKMSNPDFNRQLIKFNPSETDAILTEDLADIPLDWENPIKYATDTRNKVRRDIFLLKLLRAMGLYSSYIDHFGGYYGFDILLIDYLGSFQTTEINKSLNNFIECMLLTPYIKGIPISEVRVILDESEPAKIDWTEFALREDEEVLNESP